MYHLWCESGMRPTEYKALEWGEKQILAAFVSYKIEKHNKHIEDIERSLKGAE